MLWDGGKDVPVHSFLGWFCASCRRITLLASVRPQPERAERVNLNSNLFLKLCQVWEVGHSSPWFTQSYSKMKMTFRRDWFPVAGYIFSHIMLDFDAPDI